VDTLTVTDEQILETARAVSCVMRLCPWWTEQNGRRQRWSRTTLKMTQGWPFAARVKVWGLVMYHDPTCSGYQQPEMLERTQNGTFNADFRDRIRDYGDDGSID